MRILVWDEESKREMSGMLTTEASGDALAFHGIACGNRRRA
jgi:hypothetical protein